MGTKIEVEMGSHQDDGMAEVNTAIDAEIQKERVHAMEALAVRAMKANRKMNMNDLNTQVCKEISKFVKADAKFVRKVIEDLIVRKFFERDDDDSRVLNYIA